MAERRYAHLAPELRALRGEEMLQFGSSLIVEMTPRLSLEQREHMHSIAAVAAKIVECERNAAPVGRGKVGGERAARGA